MAVLEQQHALLLEPVEPVVLGIDPRGALPAGQAERVAEQGHDLGVAHLVGQRHKHHVEFAREHRVEERGRLLLAQVELQPRVRRQQRRHESGQQERRHGRDHAQVETPGQRLLRVTGCLDEGLGIAQHQARQRGQFLALRGDGDLLPCAIEELHVEQVLEFADGDREGGLGDEARLGRPAEMGLLDQREEVTQLPERREVGQRSPL